MKTSRFVLALSLTLSLVFLLPTASTQEKTEAKAEKNKMAHRYKAIANFRNNFEKLCCS